MTKIRRYCADILTKNDRALGLLWFYVGAAVLFLGLVGSLASSILSTVSATIIGGSFILYHAYKMYKRGRIMVNAELKNEATFRYLESNDGTYIVIEHVDIEK